MGQRLSISVITVTKATEINLKEKVVSVAIRCLGNSANTLFIGMNTDPNSNNYLEAGESMALGPFRNDDFIGGNQINLAFENDVAGNGAIVTITTEVGTVC